MEDVLELYERRSATQYLGEPVSVLAHSLQCAALAERAGAPDALVGAALLHDVGHLLHDAGEDCAERGLDAEHESLGAHWLARFFGPELVEPVRLHVDAKRYLCGARPAYRAALSAASIRSLALQGGPFAGAELESYLARPGAEAALRLRAWDDQAKLVDAPTPPLDHYAPLLRALHERART